MKNLLDIIKCEDGSHTLYRNDLDEHYHSTFGAIAESRHIFIEAGLNFQLKNLKKINVLELGFGTGLNALLTQLEAENKKIEIYYTGIESIKLSPEIHSKLNYPEQLINEKAKEYYESIHQSAWDCIHQLSSNFHLHKIESKIEDVDLPQNHFDLVYFDAFAPDVQPELWTTAIFQKLIESMNKGAVLLTYSCKGNVKRAMRSAGFEFKKLPGPKGKREFLRAAKQSVIL
jgi:tRNA U34 5-methylaminomethyl-2-thiouridine-forming methyltransferase MnmC